MINRQHCTPKMEKYNNIMRTNFKTLGVLFVLMISSVLLPKVVVAQQDYVSLQIFYDELSPYGHWIDYPKYGYAWIPDEGADFMPYSTRGQWIYTDYGWTWVSDYEWGWAPFHYGRWDYDTYYGWLWVPDYEWGPSWVTWRSASGYYGWQPMRPGISISFSFGNDYNNNYNDHWIFVRDRDFQRTNVSNYYVSRTKRDRIIRNSTVISNTYIDNSRNTTYISGPARDEVQRSTGERINSVSIRENTRPGQDFRDGQLRIYRPRVRNTNDQGNKPAPGRIDNIEDMRQRPAPNRTIQQRNTDRVNNSRIETVPDNIKQQKSREIEQPVRQRINENSPGNRRDQQQKQAIPQNKEDNKIKQDVVPNENKGKEWQQDVVTPQNNKMRDQPTRQGVQQTEPGKQELQQKTATPPNNKKNNRQSREVKAKNNKRQNN